MRQISTVFLVGLLSCANGAATSTIDASPPPPLSEDAGAQDSSTSVETSDGEVNTCDSPQYDQLHLGQAFTGDPIQDAQLEVIKDTTTDQARWWYGGVTVTTPGAPGCDQLLVAGRPANEKELFSLGRPYCPFPSVFTIDPTNLVVRSLEGRCIDMTARQYVACAGNWQSLMCLTYREPQVAGNCESRADSREICFEGDQPHNWGMSFFCNLSVSTPYEWVDPGSGPTQHLRDSSDAGSCGTYSGYDCCP